MEYEQLKSVSVTSTMSSEKIEESAVFDNNGLETVDVALDVELVNAFLNAELGIWSWMRFPFFFPFIFIP